MTESTDKTGDTRRHRASGARSKAGCLTCRQRHLRCDEQRPSCIRCLRAAKSCEYVSFILPLQDRRQQGRPSLPGQLAPWGLTSNNQASWRQLTFGTGLDVFESLPVLMQFNSEELFHYFVRMGDELGMNTPDRREDCISLVALDEYAIRGTLLIAGLHYAWNSGSLVTFQSAFLFHKIEIIRTINKWLHADDGKPMALCIRQVCTLILVEACLGNIRLAEMHLEGLHTLLDVQEQCDPDFFTGENGDNEITDRYILLIYNFVYSLKSRLKDYVIWRGTHGVDPEDDVVDADALYLMNEWHQADRIHLESSLRSLRLLPYFLSPNPVANEHVEVDAMDFVVHLRSITMMANLRHLIPGSEDRDRVWSERSPTELLLTFATSHARSSIRRTEKSDSTSYAAQKQIPTTWSAMAAASGLYLHSVLNLANRNQPIDCRLLRRVSLILMKNIDLKPYNLDPVTDGLKRDFWLWAVFTCALALSRRQDQLVGCQGTQASSSSTSTKRGPQDLQALQIRFEQRIRTWSRMSQVTFWAEAKAALARFAWPVAPPKEEAFAEKLWNKAVLGHLGEVQ